MNSSHPVSPEECHNRQGFTLLELAIVMIIIGLVLGGVVSGRNLLEAAENRAIYTDAQTYSVAIGNFVDKYEALPGDMYNAEAIWGQAAATTNCDTTDNQNKTTCSGDGDSQIELGTITGSDGQETVESFRAWQQLANADLLQTDRMSGVPGAGGTNHAVPDQNVPGGSISGSGYTLYYRGVGDAAGAGDFFGVDNEVYGHILNFGLFTVADVTEDPILLPQEAWEVDNKVDDGIPYSGTVRTYQATSHPNCATADNNTAAYQVTYTDARACNLIFITGF